jgi:hypothetical protein
VLRRRKTPIGPEIKLDRALRHVYPRYEEVFTTMYRSTLDTGLPVFDSSGVFDTSDEPVFIDVAHLNEAGNRRAAERIAQIASVDAPKLRDR